MGEENDQLRSHILFLHNNSKPVVQGVCYTYIGPPLVSPLTGLCPISGTAAAGTVSCTVPTFGYNQTSTEINWAASSTPAGDCGSGGVIAEGDTCVAECNAGYFMSEGYDGR